MLHLVVCICWADPYCEATLKVSHQKNQED